MGVCTACRCVSEVRVEMLFALFVVFWRARAEVGPSGQRVQQILQEEVRVSDIRKETYNIKEL